MTIDPSYEAEILKWRAERLAALTAEDGWLNLTDRVEIAPGRMTVGRAASSDVVISAGPDHLGTLDLDPSGAATLDSGAGPQIFQPVPDNPPRLRTGDLLLELTEVEGTHALRVRDIASPARSALTALDYFPIDPAWRIVASWHALPATRELEIDLVTGAAASVRLTHEARFSMDGEEVTLLPTHRKAGKPMFVIRDRTAGRETYGAARFLIGDEQGDNLVLDFNKAFSPPCAFTDFAVCPLPPPQNRLSFDIRAGEKKPPNH
ncbi:DUF1684 domain-containing protein [Paracoccus sediminicola]|uniref:DUF1684 domain-containing protein n=1 Tax=Paracoccus sediminicola TaxID=3017783 RepID=UPI0022F01880|nr:DUF1684 domain-containing protein [Paracoccus sediminicola]WBU56003.1 DUF1684 domain-containing protein [Paracoccus sediminicola]